MYTVHILNMINLGLFIEKSLSEVFGQIKLYKKRSRDIFFFKIRKLSRLKCKFYSTPLVTDTFNEKYCSVLTQYYKIDL